MSCVLTFFACAKKVTKKAQPIFLPTFFRGQGCGGRFLSVISHTNHFCPPFFACAKKGAKKAQPILMRNFSSLNPSSAKIGG